jgi:acyl carrier protein
MELDAFVKNFENQFDEEIPGGVSGDTVFKELDDWDSMVALSIIAMVDEQYSVKLTGNEIKESATIGDLFEVVKNKK